MMVELEDVRVEHPGGVVALDAVSVRVERGERVALIGPSGAGKSTLLGLCNATVRPTTGMVRISGEHVRDDPSWRKRSGRRVAHIPQQLHLAGRLRVVHNVNAGRLSEWSTGRALRSLIAPVELDAVRRVLDRVGIGHLLLERTDRLSGGEQQRVAIARALRQEPDVLLADEPTSSLDPGVARVVMDLLTELAVERAMTLIVSQHDVGLALETCTRVVGLRNGRVVIDAPTASIDPETVQRLYATTTNPTPVESSRSFAR
jgi:phosphonate transport system ATP-binding protein